MARNNQPAEPQQLQLSFTRYLNIEQVADILGVPKSFIYRRTARGHDDPIPTTGSEDTSASSWKMSKRGSKLTAMSRSPHRRPRWLQRFGRLPDREPPNP